MAESYGSLLLSAIAVLALATAGLALWAGRLQGRVHRLARDLDEAREELIRTQKLGSLGEMASSFAHSFNDVLTPIIGRTQLLAQRMTDPQLLEWIETIEKSAMSGARTVRRIQDFMRVRREEPTVPVDLRAVAEQAIAATAAYRRAGVQVKTELDTVPLVAGDPLGLREALGHVLANAVEASPDGASVTVAVRLEDNEAALVVVDQGVGMGRDVQMRMFEPFFSTKPNATGLGLSLAHGIVARHGGQIEVDSAPGRGTTMRLKFPVEAMPSGTARAVPTHRPAGIGGPAKCLVVEDDPQVRGMIRDMLSNAGHRVVVAVDGADGVERFKAEPFDIVISDLAMPKLNGLQLARVCKTMRPAVPVVMLTGWGVLLTENELAEHGVDEVLSKPVRMDQLLGTVAAVRARTGQEDAP